MCPLYQPAASRDPQLCAEGMEMRRQECEKVRNEAGCARLRGDALSPPREAYWYGIQSAAP